MERFIRNDLSEWIDSPAIQDASLTSWIYLDSRNLKEDGRNIKEPLPNVWTSNGSELLSDARDVKHEGSYYLTYQHDVQKMVVHTTLEEEQNGDDPAVLQLFLETALTDCLQQGQRSTEFMVIFSSHGAGFAGFGGDEHSRTLRQSNGNIATALKNALAAVEGAPTQYDVWVEEMKRMVRDHTFVVFALQLTALFAPQPVPSSLDETQECH